MRFKISLCSLVLILGMTISGCVGDGIAVEDTEAALTEVLDDVPSAPDDDIESPDQARGDAPEVEPGQLDAVIADKLRVGAIDDVIDTVGAPDHAGGLPDHGAPAAASLNVRQYPQERSYWCGPAAVRQAIWSLRYSTPSQVPSQYTLASKPHLNTTEEAGTSRQRVLREMRLYHVNYNDYPIPSVTPPRLTSFINAVKTSIAFRKAPVIANIWLVPGGPHPPGYPNTQIMHFVTIYGYAANGNTMYVVDPVSQSPHVSWGKNVPRTYAVSASRLLTMIAGKGYVATPP